MPESSSALGSLLERAASGNCTFSPAERALFMACEFWVAVETRVLVRHLGADPAESIRYQGLVFGAIGAQGVSRALVSALREYAACAGPPARRRCLDLLQERLAGTQEPVDFLIAELADRLGMSAPTHAARPASVAPIKRLA